MRFVFEIVPWLPCYFVDANYKYKTMLIVITLSNKISNEVSFINEYFLESL